jgi:3-oxoacyl-[acyl-carrier-protein] synthase-3|tara:strand:- start:125 stop:1153 length:1029 start_codon:yes stop_codon:yes gene_type:complete
MIGMNNSKIIGLGHYVPDNIVTNDDLSKLLDTSDKWIQSRTGIKERRWVTKESGDTAATMGAKAARIAIFKANLIPKDIDFIIFATMTPDYYFPGCGVQVQAELGIKDIGALDVRNQCSGFIYALSVADKFIKTGTYKNILVIGAELHSGGLDKTPRGRDVSVIFGDGAGALVLSSTDENKGILSTHLHSNGDYAEDLAVVGPSPRHGIGTENHWIKSVQDNKDATFYFPYMNGKSVFKHAVFKFSEVIMEGLLANGLDSTDVDLFIPHQANLRISEFVQRQFKFTDDQVFNNIQKYGNTTAASIVIALDEAYDQGKIKNDDLIVLASFGSGYTWGSIIIKW